MVKQFLKEEYSGSIKILNSRGTPLKFYKKDDLDEWLEVLETSNSIQIKASDDIAATEKLYHNLIDDGMLPSDFDFYSNADDYVEDEPPKEHHFEAWWDDISRSGLSYIVFDENTPQDKTYYFMQD